MACVRGAGDLHYLTIRDLCPVKIFKLRALFWLPELARDRVQRAMNPSPFLAFLFRQHRETRKRPTHRGNFTAP
jgi:hypothetical protein